ncbi:MAG: hypothetical protein EOP08_09840 [Proteobacteria bacterium]|nr:MAG: hypothetical protein EOP08_09840 [Pseudomonadota bacterium]
MGCSAFPEVTYSDDVDPITVDRDAPDAAGTGSEPGFPEADASDEVDAAIPATNPPDAGPGPGPGPTCDKNPCFGSACGQPAACERCRDACKGQTKKCCANVDPATAGGLALSCVSERERCPGENP